MSDLMQQDDIFGSMDLGGLMATSTAAPAASGQVVFGQVDARAYVRGKQPRRVPTTTTATPAAPAKPPAKAPAPAAKATPPAQAVKATRATRTTTTATTPTPTPTRRIEEAPALLRSSVLLAFLRACYREAKRRHLQLAELEGVAAPDELDPPAFTADALAFLDSPSLKAAIGLRAIAISGPVITEIAPPPKPAPAAPSTPTMAAPIAAPRGPQELATASPGSKVAHKPGAWYRQGKPHTPIVPRVVLIGDQKHPYRAPALDFRATTKGTPFMVGIGDGDEAAAGSAGAAKGRTINQHLCYCVPNAAAADQLIELHGAFATALDDLAAVLRDLGSYTLRLEEAGGPTKQKDPLTPTVIQTEDPDSTHFYWTTWKVPEPKRLPITRHTAKMVQLGDTAGLRTMDDVFVCPDDAAWRRVEAALEAVTEARAAVQASLKELGTYEEAIADNRYGSDPPTGAEMPDTTPMDAMLADAGTDADAAPAAEAEAPTAPLADAERAALERPVLANIWFDQIRRRMATLDEIAQQEAVLARQDELVRTLLADSPNRAQLDTQGANARRVLAAVRAAVETWDGTGFEVVSWLTTVPPRDSNYTGALERATIPALRYALALTDGIDGHASRAQAIQRRLRALEQTHANLPAPALPADEPDAPAAAASDPTPDGVEVEPAAPDAEGAEAAHTTDEEPAEALDTPVDDPPAEAAFDAVQAQVDSVEAFMAHAPETPPTKRQLLDQFGLLVRCGEDLDELRESGLTNSALEQQIARIRPVLLDMCRATE